MFPFTFWLASVINRCLFFTLVAIFFLGCNQKTDKMAVQSYSLIAKELKHANHLGRVYSIKSGNSYVVIRDDQLETKLSLLYPVAPPGFFRVGHIGTGPGELINPGPVILDETGFKVYDGTRKQLLTFYLDSIIHNEYYRPATAVPISEDGIVDMDRLNDTTYIATGIFPENRFILINDKGKPLFKLGEYPIELPEGTPAYIRGMACQSKLTVNRKKSTMAVATRYGGLIQFIHIDAEKLVIKELSRHETFLPEYTSRDINGSPNFTPSDKTRWGYVSVASDDDYVYALFSGKFQKKDTTFFTGNVVQVFNWSGVLVCELHLDREVLSVSSGRDVLFALYEGEAGYDLAEYSLSDIKNEN